VNILFSSLRQLNINEEKIKRKLDIEIKRDNLKTFCFIHYENLTHKANEDEKKIR
jgi:hypothetical protein